MKILTAEIKTLAAKNKTLAAKIKIIAARVFSALADALCIAAKGCVEGERNSSKIISLQLIKFTTSIFRQCFPNIWQAYLGAPQSAQRKADGDAAEQDFATPNGLPGLNLIKK